MNVRVKKRGYRRLVNNGDRGGFLCHYQAEEVVIILFSSIIILKLHCTLVYYPISTNRSHN